METLFREYVEGISDPEMREKMESVLVFCSEQYPQLKPRIGWSQPMFTDHGTYIIGFSVAKDHISIGLESTTMEHFADLIKAEGLVAKKMTFQIKRKQAIPEQLLKTIIDQTLVLKKDIHTFWF